MQVACQALHIEQGECRVKEPDLKLCWISTISLEAQLPLASVKTRLQHRHDSVAHSVGCLLHRRRRGLQKLFFSGVRAVLGCAFHGSYFEIKPVEQQPGSCCLFFCR